MYSRRRSARRKLWEIAAYKDSEQRISDSDDEEEKKAKTKCRKKSFTQCHEKNALEKWTSFGSGFDCKEEFERNKICDNAYSSKEEEALIEAASCSDDENLHSTQLSISEISCNSNKSASSCTNECGNQDINEDSECSTPTSVSALDENAQVNSPISEQVHKVSYAISPPSSPVDIAISNEKGSDWLLKIPWQPRNQKECSTETEFDSGKKKKKFVSGGFADQLHKLQSREKSAKAFWDHHNHDTRSSLCGKESLILKLTETTRSFGTVICRAVAVKSHHPNELNLFHSSTNYMDIDTNLISKNIANERSCEKYIVLLDYDQYEKLSISAGSTVQLFPPWKVLRVADFTEPVLLCTYFLQVLKEDPLSLVNNEERNHQRKDGNGEVT